MEPQHIKLLILGSGPAGYTASIYAARANLEPVIITGFNKGGQLMTTTWVENWPGDSENLTGPLLMERMEKHANSLGVKIIYDHIEHAELRMRPFKLTSSEKNIYTADSLIIATGANAKYLGIESEQNFLNRGVSGCATCDGFFYKQKPVAVVGGGNTALEEALFLANIVSHVTLVHRRTQFRAEKILVDRVMAKVQEGRISLMLDHVVEEICGDNSVNSIKLKQVHTGQVTSVEVKGVFIAIGHAPNTQLFVDQLQMQDGYLVVNNVTATQTSIPGVFAAGDVSDPIYRQAITSAGSGCMAALDAVKYLESLT